jgi:hypothetical protein
MTVTTDTTIAPILSTQPETAVHPTLDRALNGLERAAATLPMLLAVPVMLAHAGLARLGYADAVR